ncbi:response regulator [Desulfonema magnum]|uniref:Two component system response regulator/histidine kinase n=1 Tax=Desulfonema magnum TaxID=45655 RepID=A0A975GPE2_9BACT|nr:response regulator [Desulfonema magnum]QTA88916.1 Two component system response regulator/histidine kinase [Desulfonema magnum]
MKPTLLVADDNTATLQLITLQLKNMGYQIVIAENGMNAWTLLKKSPKTYDTVILDRMMPGLDGLEVLSRMKNHEILKMVPVIFQTSMDGEENILEGFQAGVDYYLTKPYKKEILQATVKAALSTYLTHKSMQEAIRRTTHALTLMKTGLFEFRDMEEAQMLATLLAAVCPKPDKTAIGLWELLLNAVEHGNLEITYKEKSRLIEDDKWLIEMKRRMALPKNASKTVSVRFERSDNEIRFLIRDQGAGFNWKSFMEYSVERAFDPHGRGIQLARTTSFDRLEYTDPGNQVLAVIHR